MAFVARPRSRTAGAEGNTGGAVVAGLDMNAAPLSFGSDFLDHSGQCRYNYYRVILFYQQLLIKFGIMPLP